MCILRRSCACNRWIFPIFAYLIGGLILLQMRIRLFTIPNLLTLMNLLCGSFAVVVALMYNDLTLAFWLIVAGIVFDFFRWFRGPSVAFVFGDRGAARFVGGCHYFGTGSCRSALAGLPADRTLLAAGDLESSGMACSSWRRFLRCVWPSSTSTKRRRSNSADFRRPPDRFSALRSACCGSRGAVALSSDGVLLIAVLTSLLLVSPIRMFALKFHGFGWRGNEVRYLFLLASIVLIIILRTYAIPVIIVLYIVVSAVRWLCMRSGNPDKAPKA